MSALTAFPEETLQKEAVGSPCAGFSSGDRKRFVIVGTGARVVNFLDPILKDFAESSTVVGLCDASPTRMRFHLDRIVREYGAAAIPAYAAEDFEKMIREQRPDTVIVCTPDTSHHEYIIRALDMGRDVISEKPITTDSVKCRAIFDAVKRSGKTVRTTFNCRWMPGPARVRELVDSGVIGTVRHVQFEEMLNTSHGADYFRRWHSEKSASGGLQIHKSTHHFDLINWWVNDIPARVFAFGELAFYGKANAVRRGEGDRTGYERYTGAAVAPNDPFQLDLDADPRLKALYKDAEAESGYIRDRNVFRDGIDIEDSLSVLIKYRSSAIASYTLNAFCPIEGCRVALTGDGGRIEYTETKYPDVRDKDGRKEIEHGGVRMDIRVIPLFSRGYDVPVLTGQGSHGGSDMLLQEQLFAANPPVDPLGRNAGHEQGAASLLIGVAVNHSLDSGQPVEIDSLLPLNPDAQKFDDLI
ncbi:MAG: Gfo/Idh/MocA family oxidoreductase [Chthoniobacterales bacterium]|nr:Gfo/Idh/MocA family oxidoreductase [Chthoniobacterales bacterium]